MAAGIVEAINLTYNNMKKTFIALAIALIGLIFWVLFIYLSIAFIQADWNAFKWVKDLRILIAVWSVMYLAFIPLIVFEIKLILLSKPCKP